MLNTSVTTRMTPEAEAVITRSLTEAMQLGHPVVRVEHLLLAILRETKGVTATALARFPAIRDEIIRALASEVLDIKPEQKFPLQLPPEREENLLDRIRGLEKDLCDHIKIKLNEES